MDDYRMFIHKPNVVMAARVNMPGTIEYPVDIINYDEVTSGSFNSVRVNMTVIFGSAPGRDDYGRTRIVAISSLNLSIPTIPEGTEDGSVTIVDNSYVTILNDYRVWAKIPYQDIDKIWYKDGHRIAVGNNAMFPPPLANGGPPVAGTVDSGGTYTVSFSAANSFGFNPSITGFLGDVTGFLWTVIDGVITSGSSTSETITVEFPPGFRWVDLRVEMNYGAFGGTTTYHTCHIPVYVRDPDDDDSISEFQILTHSHSREGKQFAVRVTQDFPRDEYYDGALVLVWNGEASSLTNRDNLLFYGWLYQDTLNTSSGDVGTIRDTVLNLADIGTRLRLLPAFTQIQSYTTNPDNWAETRYPTILYYMWYLLYWHSTALDLVDMTWSSVYGLQFLEFTELGSDEGDLYNQVHGVAQNVDPDHFLNVDRFGMLTVVQDPNLIDNRVGWPQQISMNQGDITSINYTYDPVPKLNKLIVVALAGDKDGYVVRATRVPTSGRGHGTQRIETTHKIVISGAVLDMVEGNRYAKINSAYSPFSFGLVYNQFTKQLDPAYHEWVHVQVPMKYFSHLESDEDTDFIADGLLTNISFDYDYQPTGLVVSIGIAWEIETQGPPGELHVLE